jgi:glutamine synthetase
MDQEELRALSAKGELDTIVVAGVDYQGRLFGKRLSADYLLDSHPEGTFASVAALANDIELSLVDGLSFGDALSACADLLLRPDYSTARLIPWHERTALVLADILRRDRTELPTSPRSALKRQLARARQMGLDMYTGSELEFYLFRETPETARQKDFRDLQPITEAPADYDLLRSSRDEWFLQLVRNHLIAAGIPVESSKSEYGPGQMEVNLLYAEALEMADRHALCKHSVKELALAHGFLATFMAKPFTSQPGSGGHLHLSVIDRTSGENAFFDSERDRSSDLLISFLAGVQAFAADVLLFYAPYVNSYKRYVPGLFAPFENTIGRDDRTAAFRLVGDKQSLRIENRLPGADTNGYLPMAAMTACGLHGIENQLRLSSAEPPPLPDNLVEAVERLEASEIAPILLGEELVNDAVAFGRAELKKYFREVTDWERSAYLEQI